MPARPARHRKMTASTRDGIFAWLKDDSALAGGCPGGRGMPASVVQHDRPDAIQSGVRRGAALHERD